MVNEVMREFKTAILIPILLFAFCCVAFSQNQLDLLEPSSFSYGWGEENVRLEIDRHQLAVYLPRATESPIALESQLRAKGILAAIGSIEGTRYPGLYLLQLNNGNASEVISWLDEFFLETTASAEIADQLRGGWASACLRYRGILHIPRPEILVTLDPDDRQAYDRLIDYPGISLIREFPGLKPLFLVSSGVLTRHIEQRMDELLALDGVLAASPNFIMQLNPMAVPNDTFFGSQWHLRNIGQQGNPGVDIDAVSAWDLETGSDAVRIAILDEGVDIFHEDLISRIVAGHDSTSQPAPSGVPGNCLADDAHGTSCAGLAAAAGNNGLGVTGVSWNAQIQPVRVGFGNHWTENAWVIDALTWATDNGADILSNSWGGGSPSTAEQNTIQYAQTVGRDGLGCLVVFASGNQNTAVAFPAAYNETIAVGATSPCDERKSPSSCDGDSSWGSNFGSQLTVVAPGAFLATTDNSGSGGFVNGDYLAGFSGTSAATPVVSGALALLLSQDEDISFNEARVILELSSEDQVGPPGQDTPGFDDEFGHGRINLVNMLTLVGGPQAPVNLTCTEQVIGVQLSWSPGEPYDQTLVSRDGVLLATLSGTSTGFLDTSVLTGQHTWEVQGVAGSLQSLTRSCSLFLLGDAKDLIFSPGTGPVDSGTVLANLLIQSGRSVVVTTNLSALADLDQFDRIWIQLGVFPNNQALSLEDGDRLDDYLTNGVGGDSLYMEGGDTWFFDPQTAAHLRFGITALSDGATVDNLGLVSGFQVPGCNLFGLTYNYIGENSWIDRLSANPGSTIIQFNNNPAYDIAVYRNSNTFKTFGASYELGGLADGASTKLQLLEALIQCFADLLIDPSDLFCAVTNKSAEISWTNPGGWDSVEVSLDGAIPLVLPGSATTVTFNGLSIGTHTVEVVAVAGIESSTGIACSFGVSPASPSQVLCLQQGQDVQLSWVNGEVYDSVEIFRDGVFLDALPGTETSYLDLGPGGGAHQYFVQGTFDGSDSLPTICGMVLGPLPVSSLSCVDDGSEVTISWVNSEIYDSISVLRNGVLIASLAGNSTSLVDSPGGGVHEWKIRANISGIFSTDEICFMTIPPGDPSDFICVSVGPEVSLQWTNAPGYDQIFVTRDGVPLTTVQGTVTSLVDIPGPGTFLYEITGSTDGALSNSSGCTVDVFPQAVTNLLCLYSGGSVILTWSEEPGLDGLEIRREGVPLASVSPGNGFFLDTNPIGGLNDYSVRAFSGTLSSADSLCQVLVPPGSVTDLICQNSAPGTVFMSWSPPAGSETVRIEREGIVVAEVPAITTSFVEELVPAGIQIYSFFSTVAGVDGTASSCAVDVQQQVPAPVASFIASTTFGSTPLTVGFVDTSTGIISTALWQFGDGTSSSQANPSHVFDQVGTFIVELTVTGPGGVDSSSVSIEVTAASAPFVRGDGNGDGVIDISDPVQTLDYIFGAGQVSCLAAVDFDDGGVLDIADAIAQLSYIFSNGVPPVAPFPDCGIDPTPDGLGCDSAINCP
ncbi:MAG: S8 family serine peptidase [Planctomycetota bacterium]